MERKVLAAAQLCRTEIFFGAGVSGPPREYSGRSPGHLCDIGAEIGLHLFDGVQ